MLGNPLLSLVDTDKVFKVKIRWHRLVATEATMEPLDQVFEDVPRLLMEHLRQKVSPKDLAKLAHQMLQISSEGE